MILLHMFDVLNTLIVTEDHLLFSQLCYHIMANRKKQVFFCIYTNFLTRQVINQLLFMRCVTSLTLAFLFRQQLCQILFFLLGQISIR